MPSRAVVRLLTELDIDDAHRVGRIGEVELFVCGREVVDDPLDVSLDDYALPLAADALRVDDDRLHRGRDDEEGVGDRVEPKRDAEPDVERIRMTPARVNDVRVRRDDH